MEIKLGIYRHYKTGQNYRVIGVARHSETGELLVVYEALYDNPKSKLWARPVEIFLAEVEKDGHKCRRFEWLGENSEERQAN